MLKSRLKLSVRQICRDNRRGFLLATCLGVIVFLTIGGASLLVNGISESNATIRLYHRSNALELAEAGLNRARLNLYTSETADDAMSGSLASGTFQVEEQQSLGNGIYEVQSNGTSQLENRRLQAYYSVGQKSVFQYALFGDYGVEMSGSMKTDSYDSRLGGYDKNHPNHNGNIGTNNVTSGALSMDGSSLLVDGKLFTGPGVSDPQSLVTGFNASRITGGTSPASDGNDVASIPAAIPMVPVTVPAGLACSDYTIGSQTKVTLLPGTYCYHNLQIQGGAELTAAGPVKVYLTGTLTIVGNTDVGVSSDPTKMIFYMTAGSIGTIEGTLEGTTNFYGAIYAPQATIAVGGNAEVFGAIAGRDIHATGSSLIHYDEAFNDFAGNPGYGSVTLKAWHEI